MNACKAVMAAKFVDVPSNAYYFDAVLWAYANGITEGIDATHFGPKESCTRAQIVTFLWKALGQPEHNNPTNPFTDVKEGKYYYNAVLWAYENGITSGTSETTFGTKDTCTRAQVVTFLWKALGQPEHNNTINPFTDVTEGSYYYNAVLWAVENGITSGTGETTFGTNDPCTRAQVVTFLYKCFAN